LTIYKFSELALNLKRDSPYSPSMETETFRQSLQHVSSLQEIIAK